MDPAAFFTETLTRSVYAGILAVVVLVYTLARLLRERSVSSATHYFAVVMLLALAMDLACFWVSFWQQDGSMAARFNLVYEMVLFFFLPGILLYAGEFLNDWARWNRVVRLVRWGLVGLTIAAIVAGWVQPDLVVRLQEPWLEGRPWNIGRGHYGPLARARDVVAILLILFLMLVLVLHGRTHRERKYPAILLVGLGINFLFVFDALHANLVGRYFFFPGVAYPRFATGLMFFMLASVGLDLLKFIEKAMAMDRTLEELRASQEKLVVMAYYDALTGLPNRKNFFEKIELLCLENERDPRVMAFLFLDFDLFRIVNETLGHEGGDRLLREAVFRIRQSLRSSDLLYRLGGDEFMLVLTGLNSASDAGLVAQKLLNVMEQPFEIDTMNIHITLSIGISVMPRDGRTANELYRKADEALTDAKRDRNTFRFYTSALNAEAVKKINIINSLRYAINNDLFQLYYQPLVDAAGQPRGAEALIRLDERHFSIGPEVFIPVAEHSGLIQPIGNWVLRQVVRDYVALAAEGLSVRLSVNLSPRQFRDSGFLSLLDGLVNEYRLGYEAFYLEITETVLLERDPVITNVLKNLFDRNVSLVIDDFGTGFSNLSYIRDLPLCAIKIDRSFIQPLQESRRTAQMVASIINMAKSLEMKVVAEGVETEFQRDFVLSRGADLCQGFLFARPMSLNDFKVYLRSRLSAG